MSSCRFPSFLPPIQGPCSLGEGTENAYNDPKETVNSTVQFTGVAEVSSAARFLYMQNVTFLPLGSQGGSGTLTLSAYVCHALVFSQERYLCPWIWAAAVTVPCVFLLQPLPCGLAWVGAVGMAPHHPSEVSHCAQVLEDQTQMDPPHYQVVTWSYV